MTLVTMTGIASSDDFWLPKHGASILESTTEFRFFNGTYYISVSGFGLSYSGGWPLSGFVSNVVAYSSDTFSTAAEVGRADLTLGMNFAEFFSGGAILALVSDDTLGGTLAGSGGTLKGYGGNDTLNGGSGDYAMFGGVGDDTYVVDSTSDSVRESRGEGTDTLISYISVFAPNFDSIEHFRLVGDSLTVNAVVFSTDDPLSTKGIKISGTGIGQTFIGTGQDDILDGRDNFGSSPTMQGGYGRDVYWVDSTADIVVEGFFDGPDTVASSNISLNTANYANIERFVVAGTGIQSIDAAASLVGVTLVAAGNEATLFGSNRNDIFDDRLATGLVTSFGGQGNDTYYTKRQNLIDEAVLGGIDTVVFSGSLFTLALDDAWTGIENVRLTGGTTQGVLGNALSNVLTGDEIGNSLSGAGGNDALYGGLGADELFGGDGNDFLVGGVGSDRNDGGTGNDSYIVDSIGDTVVEVSGAAGGLDLVRSSVMSLNAARYANVERFLVDQNSTTAHQSINAASLSAGVTLISKTFEATLIGGAGNDVLDARGDSGVATLTGGKGNDTYFIWNNAKISEAIGGGIDTIQYTGTRSFSLTDAGYLNIENLSLALTQGVRSATGNALNNNLIGNNSLNTLDGGLGADVLNGLGGNDFLIGSLGRDTMTGGTDADIFYFNATAETGKTATTRDIIKDFTHLHDDIHLFSIDANINVAGNQAFKFLATKGAAFTGVAGQLHWLQLNPAGTAADKTIIEGDINGDKVADFQIELTGLKVLTAADFIL